MRVFCPVDFQPSKCASAGWDNEMKVLLWPHVLWCVVEGVWKITWVMHRRTSFSMVERGLKRMQCEKSTAAAASKGGKSFLPSLDYRAIGWGVGFLARGG